MKKWLMLTLVITAMTTILTAATIKVAVLPLKRLDSASKYIQNFLTKRDLQHTFDSKANTGSKYVLLDMKETAAIFKDADIPDIDEMDKADLAELSKELNADVLVRGTINYNGLSDKRQQQFAVDLRFYSARTDELTSDKPVVEKNKLQRWDALEKSIFPTLDKFIVDAAEKIATMAVQDYQSEDYVNAEKKFNSILQYDENNYIAYKYLGLIAYKQKSYDKAINLFNQAYTILEKDKTDTKELRNSKTLLLQNMVDVYAETNNTDKMLEKQEQISRIDNDKDMWLNIANAYAKAKQTNKARSALTEALKIDPNFVNAVVRMAILLYDDRNYTEAIPYLERAVEEATSNDTKQEVSRLLATAYKLTGRITEAIAKYENLVSSNPSNSKNYLKLAELYVAATNDATDSNMIDTYNQKAIDTLNRLKAIDPNEIALYTMLADVYVSTGKLNEAETAANTAVEKDNKSYKPYMTLAAVNQRRGIDKFNQYVDVNARYLKAVGRTANQLDKDRKAAQSAALGFLRKSQENLMSAKSKTNDAPALSEINSKLTNINQLINQASSIN